MVVSGWIEMPVVLAMVVCFRRNGRSSRTETLLRLFLFLFLFPVRVVRDVADDEDPTPFGTREAAMAIAGGGMCGCVVTVAVAVVALVRVFDIASFACTTTVPGNRMPMAPTS